MVAAALRRLSSVLGVSPRPENPSLASYLTSHEHIPYACFATQASVHALSANTIYFNHSSYFFSIAVTANDFVDVGVRSTTHRGNRGPGFDFI